MELKRREKLCKKKMLRRKVDQSSEKNHGFVNIRKSSNAFILENCVGSRQTYYYLACNRMVRKIINILKGKLLAIQCSLLVMLNKVTVLKIENAINVERQSLNNTYSRFQSFCN